jgi:alpha-D-ribose 1-methylphosphonate 5-triphosphate synthase subunit PhnL
MHRSAGGASLVVGLVDEKKHAGVAIVAIVHDDEIRHLIVDRAFEVTSFASAG